MGVKRKRNGSFLCNFRIYLTRQRLGELLVMTGLISPDTLRGALQKQKQKKIPLGQLLVEEGEISRLQLNSALFKQHALRFAAGVIFFAASLGLHHKADADMIRDIPARISLTAAANSAFSSLKISPQVLGSTERRSGDLKAFTKWTGMFERFERELQNDRNDAELQAWRTRLSGLQGMPLKAMASQVNEIVNEVRYVGDNKNWGKSDYWATPIEFFARGAGDCEDFAIAKYTGLRMLGVPEDRLRVAIVHDTVKDIPHAVLIVYTDEGPYILDNQTETLMNASGKGRYRPIYSINRSAWWLHTATDTRVAAAY